MIVAPDWANWRLEIETPNSHERYMEHYLLLTTMRSEIERVAGEVPKGLLDYLPPKLGECNRAVASNGMRIVVTNVRG